MVADVVVAVNRCVVVLFSWVSGQRVTWFYLLVLYHPNALMDLCLSLLMETRGLRP